MSLLGAGSQKNHVSVRGQSDWGCCTARAWPRSKHYEPAHARRRPERLVKWANLRAHEGFVRHHMRPLLVTRVCHDKRDRSQVSKPARRGGKRGQHGWDAWVDGWMDGWMVGGVGKTRCRWDGLCPLPNTDAGNLEYCCLLRGCAPGGHCTRRLSWKRTRRGRAPFFLVSQATDKEDAEATPVFHTSHGEMGRSLSGWPGHSQGSPCCDTSLPPQMNMAKNQLGQTRT